MDDPSPADRRVPRYVLAVGALAALSLGAATMLQLRQGVPPATPYNVAAILLFTTAFFVLGQTSFTFVWRGHRHRMVLDEVVLFLGLLVLPAPLVVLLVTAASVTEQARMRRGLLKAGFNLAQAVLAASLAAALYVGVAALGQPPVLAALVATLAHPLASNFLVAGILGRLAGEGHLRAFREKFLGPGLVAGSVGAGGGVAVATLWSVHPLTLLSLGPFVFLTYRYGVLAASADRELHVHKRLAEAARDVVGTRDVEQAARRVLRACGASFPGCGRAELVLEGREAIGEDFAEGPDPRAAPLEEPVPGDARVSAGAEGRPIGVLRILPRRGANEVSDVEKELVRLVAAQLGAAIEETRALSMEERARRRLETYLRAAPDAILLVERGRARPANPAAEALFGLAPGQEPPLSSLLPQGEHALAWARGERLVETSARDASGARAMVVEVHAAPLPGSDGVLLLVRDVTARKLLEEESARQREALSRQEKLSALGTLVAGVAHEINNPVTYMRGALELASMDLDEVRASAGGSKDAEAAVAHARVSLQRLSEGVDRVARITGSLKAVARQGNGERAPEDVSAIADDVAQVVRVGLPKGVRLDAELARGLPRVRANAPELHQVILNLVKNACEALAPGGGGQVRLRSWTAGGDVLVEVADDGPGIPDDVQRRLFEPFFTTKRSGTGLGLSLSKGIVEAHGGELLLDSAPGRGTRFTLRLPAEAAPA